MNSTDSPEAQAYKSKSYRYYALAVLTLVYIFNFVDRQIIVILSEYIIEDLDLTFTQYGMLSGIAFAAIYCVFGIPIARFADKGNRRNVIVFSLTVWCAFHYCMCTKTLKQSLANAPA